MIEKRPIGSTGLTVSVLGLGTVKFGRNQAVKYPQPFEIPDDKRLLNLLATAYNLGINLLDTAPAYGHSEERLGTLLQGQRKNWVIATKVGEEFVNGESLYNFTPEHARMSIERSLKQLKTDYLDAVLVHSDGNDVHNIQHFGILEFLSSLKKEGLIRATGMSTKTIEGGLLALSLSDIVMVTYNPIETAERPVITKAHELNKGILIKKAFASGHLDKIPGDNPVRTTLQFILKEPGVSSIILGTLNPKHLAENVAAITP
jgi:aryl-alcohol dehydrogenase-like predicted oxidoreductase